MKGTIKKGDNGYLKVVPDQEIEERKLKASSLIKKAKDILSMVKSEKKELRKRVLAAKGIKKMFTDGKATEKEVKRVVKAADNQINILEEILDKLKEVFKSLIEVKGEEIISEDEKKEIKDLLEEAEEADIETEEELEDAEKSLLEEAEDGKEEEEEKAAEADTEKKTAEGEEPKEEEKKEEEKKEEKKEETTKESKKSALDEVKEKAQEVVEQSTSSEDEKEKAKAQIELSETEEDVMNALKESKVSKPAPVKESKKEASNEKKDAKTKKIAEIIRNIKAEREKKGAANELSPRFLYEDAGVRKDYKMKDVESEAARKETTQNDAWRRELKTVDRGFLTRGYPAPSKAKNTAASLDIRRASIKLEKAFDLAAEKQFKGFIDNPLKEALIKNLGEDAIPAIEQSFVEAADVTFDAVKSEARKLSSLEARDFVKEAKLVRREVPESMETMNENDSVSIKTGSTEESPFKNYLAKRAERPLGAIGY